MHLCFNTFNLRFRHLRVYHILQMLCVTLFYFDQLLPQWLEQHQLVLAARDGDVATVERLVTTRYIDVNTADWVSTLYGVVLVCD